MGAVLGAELSLAQDREQAVLDSETQGTVSNSWETITAESEVTSWQVLNKGVLEILDGGAATRVRADGANSWVIVNGGRVT